MHSSSNLPLSPCCFNMRYTYNYFHKKYTFGSRCSFSLVLILCIKLFQKEIFVHGYLHKILDSLWKFKQVGCTVVYLLIII